MSGLIRSLGSWWKVARPGPEAARGAMIAVALAGLAGAFLFEFSAGFGLARWLDLLVAVGCAAGTMAICGGIGEWLLKVVRRGPHRFPGFVVGAALVWAVLFVATPAPFLLGFMVVVPQALLGAALGMLLSSGLRTAPLARRASGAGLLLVALALELVLVTHARSEGDDLSLPSPGREPAAAPTAVAAPDPSQRGAYAVRTLTYGSGSDRRRPEFGPSVALQTPSVDGSRLLRNEPALRGLSGGYRRWYWGFDATALPINGRVWYPSGDGPFPLVLIVHGNALMTTPSDIGYGYLGELLASRGFIVASVDENFLNLGITADTTGEAAARGWLLLEHLKVWRGWAHQAGNLFSERVDLGRIALVGHSRGGEAVATAAVFNAQPRWSDDANVAFDFGFGIRALVAIAPVDFGYAPSGIRSRKTLSGVDYLLIQGGQDAQLPVFAGSRQYNRTLIGEAHFKAEIYIDRANHAQFNTTWGRADFPVPISWLLADRPVLPGEQQRAIASTYISAFLETSLHGRREYLPLLRNPRVGRAWLPDTILRQRFQDPTFRLAAGFDEDTNAATTTMPAGSIEGRELTTWREGPVPFRLWTDRQDTAVYLAGARSGGSYAVTLPEGGAAALGVTPASSLQLSMALTGAEPLAAGRCDPSFDLADEAGVAATVPLSHFGALLPPPEARYYKWKYLDAAMGHALAEIVPQTYTLPLSAFVAARPAFQPGRLRSIRLRLDGCPSGEVLIDEVGFSN